MITESISLGAPDGMAVSSLFDVGVTADVVLVIIGCSGTITGCLGFAQTSSNEGNSSLEALESSLDVGNIFHVFGFLWD